MMQRLAQVTTELVNPLSGSDFNNLGDIFGFVISLIIFIGWALVFVMLALGFTQYVMSKGDDTAVKSAQQWVTYAVIGGVGLFFIGIIRTLIPTLIGADESLNVTGITDF